MGPTQSRSANLAAENELLHRQLAGLQEAYRTLATATGQLAWQADSEGGLQEAPDWCAYTGQTLAEAQGAGWLEALHPEDRAATWQAWKMANRTRSLYQSAYRLRAPGGSYRWFQAKGVPILDAAGRVQRWVGTSTDIEDEKQSLERLKESEANLAEAQAIAHIGSWVWDLETDRSVWSPEMFRIYGLEPLDTLNAASETVRQIHPDDRTKVEDALQATLTRGIPYHIAYRISRPDGSMRIIDVRGVVSRDDRQEPVRMAGTVQDITDRWHLDEELKRQKERVEAEVVRRTEALQKSETRLAEAQELARIGSWEWDVAANQIYWSNEQYRLFGYAPQECQPTYQTVLDRIHPDDRAHHDAIVTSALQDPPPYRFDHRVVHPDGTILVLHSIGRGVMDADGQVIRLVGTSQDVTVQRRLEAEHTEALEQANQMKDEFLSVISHELRTPLNFIMGFASILEDEISGPMNALQHEYLTKLTNGADRMLVLVNNLLDMSRMAAGKFHVVPSLSAYQGVVAEAINALEPLAREKRLALEADVAVQREVLIDGPRIIQVLTNLVDNAIKFTPPGGEIRIRAYMHDEQLVTEVVDSGPGIAREDRQKLFQPFGQLDMSATRKVGGTGLGLSICKTIVEAHGGQMGVTSEGGQGAAFWFTLPVRQEIGEP